MDLVLAGQLAVPMMSIANHNYPKIFQAFLNGTCDLNSGGDKSESDHGACRLPTTKVMESLSATSPEGRV